MYSRANTERNKVVEKKHDQAGNGRRPEARNPAVQVGDSLRNYSSMFS